MPPLPGGVDMATIVSSVFIGGRLGSLSAGPSALGPRRTTTTTGATRIYRHRKEAADSCKSLGKRLCSQAEWRSGCQGPDGETYPYGAKYNENHCPAKEAAASRSGRFPVCRSYYGLYDMTGNLWEWTASQAPDPDFYMVAGGNWTAGNQATCSYAKFSFYPSVRYPFVGFRCCQDAGAVP